jgi:PKHD-type hydroxylase
MRFSKTNDSLCFIAVKNFLTADECDALINNLTDNWQNGISVGGSGDYDDNTARRVKVWMEDLDDNLIFKIGQTIIEANERFYKFNLSGFFDYDACKIFKYEDSIKARYTWHNDLGQDLMSTRKLSFSIQLNDPSSYEGGALEFMPDFGKPTAEKGSIIVFPSYLTHRVTTITRGTRYCIVGWVHGPAFQ